MFVSKNDRQDKSLIGQVHDQAGHCPLTCRYFEPCQLAGGKPIWAISKSGFKELNSGLPRTNPAGGQAGGGGNLNSGPPNCKSSALLNCSATPPLPTRANISQILPNLYFTKFNWRNLFKPPHNDSPPQRPPWGQKEECRSTTY